MKATAPVPDFAAAVASWVKVLPLSVDRWITNPLSTVEVSVHPRLTRTVAPGPGTPLAVRLFGAVGAGGRLAPIGSDVDFTVMDGIPEP